MHKESVLLIMLYSVITIFNFGCYNWVKHFAVLRWLSCIFQGQMSMQQLPLVIHHCPLLVKMVTLMSPMFSFQWGLNW